MKDRDNGGEKLGVGRNVVLGSKFNKDNREYD